MKKLIILLIILIYSFFLAADESIHCAECNKEIMEGVYYKVEDKNYCEECYKKCIQITCDYCNLPIEGEYQIDFWGNKFHSHHIKELDKCEFCNRLISEKVTNGGKQYPDGTKICNLCYPTAVFDKHSVEQLRDDVISELAWHGIRIDKENITIHLKDKKELAKIGENKAVIPHQKGLAIHNYTTNSKQEIVSQRFDVYILEGLPEFYFIKVLAHELMHVWQFRNAIIDNELALNEGSCNYAAYLVLQSIGKMPRYSFEPDSKKKIEYLLLTLENNDDPIYGQGFRVVKKMVDRMGVSYWLRYLQTYDKLP